jgi:pectate lyase
MIYLKSYIYRFILFLFFFIPAIPFSQSLFTKQTEKSEFEQYLTSNIDSLIGFAAAEWNGLVTTTGGEGGDSVEVISGTQMDSILLARKDPHFDENHPPVIFIIKDTLYFSVDEMLDVKETYNLSILGSGKAAVIEGFGLNIFRSYNIIIRNIEFRDCPDDAISVDGVQTHHIWIDHCTFSDSPDIDPDAERHDGLVDIKHGANYVTVSWNHFYNHKNTCLLGHSDNNAEEDSGCLKVTYHHNWFDNTYARHPRVRFGECHVFNNYYDNSQGGMDYGIASTEEADVVVEANYFKNVEHPTRVGYGSSSEGDILELNNSYENCGDLETRGDAFDPGTYYAYDPDTSVDVPSIVMAGAGAGKIPSDDPTSINIENDQRVHTFTLMQNYPNPFNPDTYIIYELSHTTRVSLTIYNILGQKVSALVDEIQNEGYYQVLWQAKDLSGNRLPSGMYLAKLQTSEGINIIKMLMIQ